MWEINGKHQRISRFYLRTTVGSAENIEIFDFELTDDEMAKIADLDGKMRFFTMSEENQEKQFANYAPDFNNQR